MVSIFFFFSFLGLFYHLIEEVGGGGVKHSQNAMYGNLGPENQVLLHRL
jgi:hypothetical protein